jgi:formate hydrogenlyase subunit 3/multisubunit Na+/H+ antiporter MnhD subunit
MTTNATTHPWRTSLAWSAAFSAAGLFCFGFLGGLWLFWAGAPAGKAVSLAAVLTLAALVGVTWFLSRARADRRWRAALDRYAERQMADGAHPPDQHLEGNRVHLQRRAAS